MIIIDDTPFNANMGRVKIVTDVTVEEYSDTSGETLDGRYLPDIKGTSLVLQIPLKTHGMTKQEIKNLFEVIGDNKLHTMYIPLNGETQNRNVYITAGRRTDIVRWDAQNEQYVFDYSTISDITVRLQNYWRK